MKSRRKRGRAFLFLNMMVVLGLIAAFAVMAEHIARLSLQTLNKTGVEQDELIRIERALFQLREDVWNASSVEAIDKEHVRVTSDRGIAIDWQTVLPGDLTRTEKGEEQHWADLKLSFERQGVWLVVRRGVAEVALFQQAKATGGTK